MSRNTTPRDLFVKQIGATIADLREALRAGESAYRHLATARMLNPGDLSALGQWLIDGRVILRSVSEKDPERTPVVTPSDGTPIPVVPPPPRVPTFRSMPAPPSDPNPTKEKK